MRKRDYSYLTVISQAVDKVENQQLFVFILKIM